MKRSAAALKASQNCVEIYDHNGLYMHRISFGSESVTGASLNGTMLSVTLSSGKLKVYSLVAGCSPILKFTR